MTSLGKRKAQPETENARERKAAKPVQYGQEKNLDWVDTVVDFGVPDFLSRAGVRKLMAQRKEGLMVGGVEAAVERKAVFLDGVCKGDISAPHHSNAANEQHYEVCIIYKVFLVILLFISFPDRFYQANNLQSRPLLKRSKMPLVFFLPRLFFAACCSRGICFFLQVVSLCL